MKRNRIFDIVLSLSGLDKEENLKDLMLDLQKENEARLADELEALGMDHDMEEAKCMDMYDRDDDDSEDEECE